MELELTSLNSAKDNGTILTFLVLSQPSDRLETVIIVIVNDLVQKL